MESAITDNPDASSATDDQHPRSSSIADGRFSYSVIHNYFSKRSYPAHFSEEDKRAFRKRAQHFACTEDGELYYVGGASSTVEALIKAPLKNNYDPQRRLVWSAKNYFGPLGAPCLERRL